MATAALTLFGVYLLVAFRSSSAFAANSTRSSTRDDSSGDRLHLAL